MSDAVRAIAAFSLLLLILFGVSQCRRADELQVKLSRCETSIDRQNDAIDKLSKQSEAALAEAEAEVTAARRENRAAKDRLNRFLAQPIQGDTVCERLLDVDRRFLEEIVQ